MAPLTPAELQAPDRLSGEQTLSLAVSPLTNPSGFEEVSDPWLHRQPVTQSGHKAT